MEDSSDNDSTKCASEIASEILSEYHTSNAEKKLEFYKDYLGDDYEKIKQIFEEDRKKFIQSQMKKRREIEILILKNRIKELEGENSENEEEETTKSSNEGKETIKSSNGGKETIKYPNGDKYVGQSKKSKRH